MDGMPTKTHGIAAAIWTVSFCLVGCAPRAFQDALTLSVEQNRVVDAAARRADAAWFLRFDALLLSDLDDAIAAADTDAKRALAADVYRSAARLARDVTHREIDRLPAPARSALAERFHVKANPTALHERFDRDAAEALRRDLAAIETASAKSLQQKLLALRQSVSPLPDDRGRLGRQLMLCWAALPAWIGLENEEAKLRDKSDAMAARQLDHVALWRPVPRAGDDLLARFAPIIAVEWPDRRPYPEGNDRIGGVRLRRDGGAIVVVVDPTDPHVYAYNWVAKIHGRRYPQLVYVWWFPERPPMTANDPSAGHIDGGMLRLTLDSHQRPVIGEASLNCGCGHRVFVASALENAARHEFSEALPGNRFAIEQDTDRAHDVIVADTFDTPPENARPVVFQSAGYHEVCKLDFVDAARAAALRATEETSYRLVPYDVLDTLPLDGGVGSMFGPDGLVHDAGRRSGYLLAPTGILSAGQPRKRGTHRVRWDDYLFDDPHLLERTLRLPRGF
ncbi:MAG: hypothetical protein HRF50_18205 [Phycisphaerae bacterium]|jgi:hypothetical protein